MPSRTTSATALAEGVTDPRTAALSPLAFRFLVIVVVVQGGHVIEHIAAGIAGVSRSACRRMTRSAYSDTCCSSTARRNGCTSGSTACTFLASTRSSCHCGGSRPACSRRGRSWFFIAAERLDRDLAHGRARRDHRQRDRQRRLPVSGYRRRRRSASATRSCTSSTTESLTRVWRWLSIYVLRDRGYTPRRPRRRVPARFARRDATRRDKRDRVRLLATATAPRRIGGPDLRLPAPRARVATIEGALLHRVRKALAGSAPSA